MPYAEDLIGIYQIRNIVTGQNYIGQSQYLKKRVHEHFRLLRLNTHPNPKLQNSFNKYGEDAFQWDFEVICSDTSELDILENAFLSGEAYFESPCFFNIAKEANVPMRGRKHTEASKRKMSASQKLSKHWERPGYGEALSKGQMRRYMSDPEYKRKVKFIIENPHLSYAERGRQTNMDTSSARKKYLKYKHLKGEL